MLPPRLPAERRNDAKGLRARVRARRRRLRGSLRISADVLVDVGSEKGEVLAFDGDGKARWTARVSSEVIAPPLVADNIVIVFSGDGRIYGLAAADGKTIWVDPRTSPSLTVRNAAGGVAARGG